MAKKKKDGPKKENKRKETECLVKGKGKREMARWHAISLFDLRERQIFRHVWQICHVQEAGAFTNSCDIETFGVVCYVIHTHTHTHTYTHSLTLKHTHDPIATGYTYQLHVTRDK